MAKQRIQITEQLRDAVENCGKSRYRISLESGISQATLSRFVHAEREISLAKAETLADAIGARLTLETTKTKRRK